MTKPCVILLVACVAILHPLKARGADSSDSLYKAFETKLLYSETPDIGPAWRGGLRITDLIVWDGYLNVAGWFTMDLFMAGIPSLSLNDSSKTRVADNFILFSVKSRPFRVPVRGNLYEIGGGIKYHSAEFELANKDGEIASENTVMVVPFVTQSFLLAKRNHFNLFTCVALENRDLDNGARLFATYCLVPGYRFFISDHWSLGMEYPLFNARKMPLNLIWYLWDADHVSFDNPDADWYSLMFWGASFANRHFRLDLNIACHYSFKGPIIPMIGFGWNF
jgi:hypothetical protein